MFCGSCGARNSDSGTDCCVNCGSKLDNSKLVSSSYKETDTLPASRQQKKTRAIGVTIVGMAAVIVVIFGVYLFGSGQSYESIIEKYIDAVYKGDGEAVVDLFYDEEVVTAYEAKEIRRRENLYGITTDFNYAENISQNFEYRKEQLDEELGTGWSIDYSIVSDKGVSSSNLADIVEQYYDVLELELDISESREVEVEVTITSEDGRTNRTVIYTLSTINVKGSWYLDILNLESRSPDEDDD